MSQKLEIVRGCSYPVAIDLFDENGEAAVLDTGSVLVMGIQPILGGEPVLKKQAVSTEDGALVFDFCPADTEKVTPGDYKFDVMLQTGDDLYPVISRGNLSIVDNAVEWGDGVAETDS